MSILIKGMEMPKSCNECRFSEGDTMDGLCHAADKWFDDEYFRWFAYAEDDIDDSKPINCPLVEVLPHGDLIDREELLNDAGGVYTARPEEAQKIQHEINKVLFAIQDAPTVIEAEGK